MKYYRIDTRISSSGSIQLPNITSLLNKDVELIIVPKEEKKESNDFASKFIKKWSGFLKDDDINDAKYNYIMEKHK